MTRATAWEESKLSIWPSIEFAVVAATPSSAQAVKVSLITQEKLAKRLCIRRRPESAVSVAQRFTVPHRAWKRHSEMYAEHQNVWHLWVHHVTRCTCVATRAEDLPMKRNACHAWTKNVLPNLTCVTRRKHSWTGSTRTHTAPFAILQALEKCRV